MDHQLVVMQFSDGRYLTKAMGMSEHLSNAWAMTPNEVLRYTQAMFILAKPWPTKMWRVTFEYFRFPPVKTLGPAIELRLDPVVTKWMGAHRSHISAADLNSLYLFLAALFHHVELERNGAKLAVSSADGVRIQIFTDDGDVAIVSAMADRISHMGLHAVANIQVAMAMWMFGLLPAI